MTVRELIEKLEQFPANCIVMIPNQSWHPDGHTPSHVPVTNVAIGCNEADGCVFLDDYEEDEDMNNGDDWVRELFRTR